jgi:hypothetical protein
VALRLTCTGGGVPLRPCARALLRPGCSQRSEPCSDPEPQSDAALSILAPDTFLGRGSLVLARGGASLPSLQAKLRFQKNEEQTGLGGKTWRKDFEHLLHSFVHSFIHSPSTTPHVSGVCWIPALLSYPLNPMRGSRTLENN